MVKVIQVGVGPLGQRVVRYAVERKQIKVVGAADPAPKKLGKDLGELCGLKRMGIRMKKDAAAALGRKTADVALMSDDLSRLPWLVRHARRTLRVIQQNVALAIGLKLAVLLLAGLGYATLWLAIVADMGASLLVIFNALRLLRSEE